MLTAYMDTVLSIIILLLFCATIFSFLTFYYLNKGNIPKDLDDVAVRYLPTKASDVLDIRTATLNGDYLVRRYAIEQHIDLHERHSKLFDRNEELKGKLRDLEERFEGLLEDHEALKEENVELKLQLAKLDKPTIGTGPDKAPVKNKK